MQAALGGNDMYALKDLIAGYAQEGCVTWLGLRGERRGEMSVVDEALITEAGLEGRPWPSGQACCDAYSGRAPAGHRGHVGAGWRLTWL